MVKIIDATLCMLDDYCLSSEQVLAYLGIMSGIGIRDIQISLRIYDLLVGNLPEGHCFYLEVPTQSFLNDDYPRDPGIRYYFTPKQTHGPNEIATFQVNTLEEPQGPVSGNSSAIQELIQIKGLDRLFLTGSTAGMEQLKKKYNPARLILSPEDTYHCATAIAIQFLQNKGNAVVTTVCGIGNKASTEQVLLALHVMDRYLANHKFCQMTLLKSWMEEVLRIRISPIAPVFGNHIFFVESGVHVDGIMKKPSNYEPYPPELVGLTREVVLGKHSGTSSISYKMELLFQKSCESEKAEKLLELVKDRSRKKGAAISDEEFIQIVEGYEMDEKKA